MVTRRQLLSGLVASAAFNDQTLGVVERAVTGYGSRIEAQDEDFWFQIQQAFTLDRTMINLNNGGVCPSPRVVVEALKRQIDYANQAPSYFMWRHQEPEVENVRRRLALFFGCDAEEVAITRNASEALEILLLGLPINKGDEVLTTDADYPRMITTIKQRERRDGIKLVQVPIRGVPSSTDEMVRAFRNGVTSKTKMLLVSQVAFQNGQIFPVSEIVKLGNELGIPTIVDGAHAFAQFPIKRDGLGCDYYGTSLHKWLMAPVGTGMLFVRKPKIEGVWPLMACSPEQDKDIRKFEEIGTHPAANHNAIGEALTFTELIGTERKAARLRYLRSIWADPLRNERRVRFQTNLDPAHSCGLTTVEIEGITSEALTAWLWDKKGIFTVGINAATYKGIRVTANVYTTLDEIRRFRDAMLEAVTKGIG